jgi:hypothetical protein
MRVGKYAAIAVLGGMLLCSTAFAAPGKLVGKGSDGGFPIAYARANAFNPRAILVRVSGQPSSPVEVRWQVTCRTGRKKAKVPADEYVTTPTDLRKVKLGGRRPEDCTVDVQAAYVDANVSGSLKIEVFARARKKR